jgi:predicted ATPase/DNA-binding SARP family transcriptional activator
MCLVLEAACALGLRWDCRGAEMASTTSKGCPRQRSYGGAMEVKLFGEFEVTRTDVPVPVRGGKQRALLALLALNRGAPVSADQLIDQLWVDGQATKPANALQAQIGQLRRSLGASSIITSDAGYALAIAPEEIDVVRFERLVARGRTLILEGDREQGSAVLGEALELRRGEPLAEFAYAEFARSERAHLEELTVVAAEARAEADLARGHHGVLVDQLEALCQQHPLRERVWELRMLALYEAGRQAEALRAYTEIRDRLVEELGIEPGPALRDLEARILVQDPSLRVLERQRPRAAATPTLAGNVVEGLSSFVGRDLELESLGEAVRSSRLVTLIGPGGVGKTRLATQMAARLRDRHPGGAWLVDLAGVTDPDAVSPVAAATLGAAGSTLAGSHPPETTTEHIVRHLAGRSLVVVLDNCEHVIDQAAILAHTLVAAVPGLRMIATSREPLRVPGERVIPISGLAPSVAVELFVDRACAVLPGFGSGGTAGDLIEDICRQLDGLPLAIELAAARLRVLPLSALAQRLDDRFAVLTRGARIALPRQQTLRAVVDWSYDLLFDDEQHLFDRLSVFAGGCELDAVESVCADDEVPREEAFDLMSRLVDKSLVTAPATGETRFTQLQTLRQYGRDRLDESGEGDAVRARHADYYLHMALDASRGLRGASAPAWHDRLTSELANLKAALDWYLATGDADAALSMASGMAWLWFLNSDFSEGARWLASALGAEGQPHSELQTTARVWHGYCVGMSSSPSAGVAECEEAIAVLRLGRDRVRLAEALLLQASVLVRAYEFDRSLEALGEAHTLLEPDQDLWLLGAHDMLVTWNMASFGRLEEAETSARSSIARFDAVGEVVLVVNSLNALAGVAAARGDLAGAAVAYEALLERCRASVQHPYLNLALVALASLRARQGDDNAADDLYREAIGCCFNPWLSADAIVGQAAAARRLGDLGRARALLDAAADLYRDADLPAGQPRVLAGLAWWALGAGQPDAAVIYAVDAVNLAGKMGDSESKVLADSAFAAAKSIAEPTQHHTDNFIALVQRRTLGPSHRALTDEADLMALAARLEPLLN